MTAEMTSAVGLAAGLLTEELRLVRRVSGLRFSQRNRFKHVLGISGCMNKVLILEAAWLMMC